MPANCQGFDACFLAAAGGFGLICRPKRTSHDHRGIGRMRAISVFAIIGITVALAACVPPTAPPLNSLAFERRPPLSGQPGYLETIKYVDDGLRYIAPNAGFFVSAFGEMCFQGSIIPGVTPELTPPYYWCLSPLDVSSVDALENDTSYVNNVRLWCRHASPQCAHKIAYPNMFDNATVADSITAETIPFKEEQAAIEYLVYLMGGAVERDAALQ
jgi:hypothetical protein